MSKFAGQDQFEAYLRNARANAEREARRACELAANEAAALAKASVSKGDARGGHIQDSIRVVKIDADTWAVKVGDAAREYAAPLEFGHAAPDGSRVPPRKFFFPAIRVVNKRHRARIRRWFRKAIRATGGGE